MKRTKIMLGLLLAVLMVFGAISSASALEISPSSSPRWTGSETGVPKIFAEIHDDFGITINKSNELYKATPGTFDSGAVAPYYETSFGANNESAIITWNGTGNYIHVTTDPLYLLVKDGNNNPAWYLFNLAAPTSLWDGMETIYLNNFWVGTQGSISHVSMYGESTTVPEPATLLFLGLGLVGLAGLKRKFNK